MRVGVLKLELEIQGARSLKEKRSVLKGLKDNIRNNFNVSISEVDNHDKWQRATIAIACVSNDRAHLDAVLSKVLESVERKTGVIVLDCATEVL